MITGDFNTRPTSGWEELSTEDFVERYYFTYCLKKPISRQIRYDEEGYNSGLFNARLYELEYDGCEDMGIAIVSDWKAGKLNKADANARLKFYRFGGKDRWEKFRNKFAGQFAGDNS